MLRTAPGISSTGPVSTPRSASAARCFAEVVDEQRHHRAARLLGVADDIQPARVRELPGRLVVVREHRWRLPQQPLVEVDRRLTVTDMDAGEYLGEAHLPITI